MWHIAKRELYDNLNSLRFTLATVLLIGLMLTNAVVHLQEHPKRIQAYRDGVAEYEDRLTAFADESLYRLAQKGPGDLHKKPSPLRFCAEGSETDLPRTTEGLIRWTTQTLESFWILRYPPVNTSLGSLRPDATLVDWSFIIGYVLSLIALLFTFDSISGERERGTLRLILANAIPRHTVLIGKFLGALISLSIPFTLATLMNLLVISTSSDIHLGAETWERLGIIFFIALLYTCLFLALGLLVSARVQRSAVSLVILLLVWVSLVVFMPGTLAAIAGDSASPKATHGLYERSWQLHYALEDQYSSRWREARGDSRKRMEVDGAFVSEDAEQQEHLQEARLKQQISQVNRARAITRLSPVTIFQHLLESFAGTGFERHQQFLENVKVYAREYREFVVDTDKADPESLHIIGVREGMSQKPVSPEAVPKFEDTLNFSKDFNTAAMDLLLLTLFFLVLLSGAYLAFVRVEV